MQSAQVGVCLAGSKNNSKVSGAEVEGLMG